MSLYESYLKGRSREYCLGYRFKKRRLVEELAGDATEAYNEIWISAVEFFTKERDDLVDLPPDSRERLFVEGVLGILRQYETDKLDSATNDDIRANAMRIVHSLEDLRDGASDAMREYVDKLISGMRDLHNRIDPDGAMGAEGDIGEPVDEPPQDEAPTGGESEEEGEGEGEEDEEEEIPEPEDPNHLAKVLGLDQ